MNAPDLVADCVCGMNDTFDRHYYADSNFVLQRHTQNKGVCQFWDNLIRRTDVPTRVTDTRIILVAQHGCGQDRWQQKIVPELANNL